tara:strand:+ start:60 stop:677 length:618 start_codon:yes stop_codon:yes gene_type:complete
MRFGISHMIPLIFICLNFQLSYSQAIQTSETKVSEFRGKSCDDTEYRDEWGKANWKNYGQWLSECDSLQDTYYDSVFAVDRAKKDRQKAIQDSIDLAEIEDINFDMDAMWEQAEWEEIQDITTVYYDTEVITAVAGVRGAEAEDEALAHLYYRKSMKGISLEDYKKAYGKLKNTRDDLFGRNPNHPKLERMDVLLLEIKNKIKNS